jgi:PAS domain S-box-containing protein
MSEENKKNDIGLCRKVTDHVSAMLAYWDKDLMCRFANAAYLQWFGKCQEEMVGKITLPELLGPLYEKNKPYIDSALNGEIQTFERDIPIPDGTGIRSSLANYYPDIVDGEVKGFIVHVADVSPIKKLELELKHSNETIRKQNQGLLNFSNIVTHNLRSYANNLEAMLNLYADTENETEKKEFFGFLLTISKGFSDTVEHLSDIVKMQNENNITFERINLHDYIEKIIQILHLQAKYSNAIIKNEVDAKTTLMANPAYMESILLNFLTNAIKYKHPERNPEITITCENKDGKSVLSIKDNGLGINLEKHSKDLFGIYKTFHNNPDAQGIGLFITKYQVEAMGATVEVQSKENEGSTFSVIFNNIPELS